MTKINPTGWNDCSIILGSWTKTLKGWNNLISQKLTWNIKLWTWNLIRIPHPLPHFFERRFFAIHQNSNAVNFWSQKNHQQHRADKQWKRKCNFPPFHTKWQSCYHRNRWSQGDDRKPKWNRSVWIVHRGQTSVHRYHHRENRVKCKLLCISVVVNSWANRCENRAVK